jgi:hypothetical protein
VERPGKWCRLRFQASEGDYCFGAVPRSWMVEPTEDDPNDEPTPDSLRLEPTLEPPKLDPTDESDRLDPTVERCRDEPTAEDDSLLRVDSPIEGPARPVAPIPNPVGPELPMSWLFFDDAPMPWPVTPPAPIVSPVFGVFPILGPAAGALPMLAPVLGPVDNFGAWMSLSIDSSISRIALASRPEASKPRELRVLVEVLMRSSVARSFFRSARALETVGIISWSMMPREAIE